MQAIRKHRTVSIAKFLSGKVRVFLVHKSPDSGDDSYVVQALVPVLRRGVTKYHRWESPEEFFRRSQQRPFDMTFRRDIDRVRREIARGIARGELPPEAFAYRVNGTLDFVVPEFGASLASEIGGPRGTSAGQGRLPLRSNPGLLLVTGNPPTAPAALERAWCEFHQRDRFTGTLRDVGPIPGAPRYGFACGRFHSIELGRGEQSLARGGVWVVCDTDRKLWIISEREPMDFGKLSGKPVHALTYEPMTSSGKEQAYFRHDFKEPFPVLCPVAPANRCRAVKLDGGVYTVRDWLYD